MNVAKLVGVGMGLALVGCGDLTETVDPSICESGTRWIGEDEGDPEMMPGEPCLSCHTGKDDAPRFGFAGTVYDSGDQGTRCFGVGGIEVIITDANGVEHRLTSNRAGNFYSTEAIAVPYRARLVINGADIPMTAPQTNGDCNGCHRSGGAAGLRIFAAL